MKRRVQSASVADLIEVARLLGPLRAGATLLADQDVRAAMSAAAKP